MLVAVAWLYLAGAYFKRPTVSVVLTGLSGGLTVIYSRHRSL
jgi:hypothetical protein